MYVLLIMSFSVLLLGSFFELCRLLHLYFFTFVVSPLVTILLSRRHSMSYHYDCYYYSFLTIILKTDCHHRPQFFFRTADVTGTCTLPTGVEMVSE